MAAPCMHYFHGNSNLPVSSLAESPAVLCAETAKRGDYLPLPATGHWGQQQAAQEQKPCLQQSGVWGGGRQGRKDKLPFLVGDSASPNAQKCSLTPQCCTSPQATHTSPSCTRIASFGICIIRDEKFKQRFHTGTPVLNKMEVDQAGWQVLLSRGSLAPHVSSNLTESKTSKLRQDQAKAAPPQTEHIENTSIRWPGRYFPLAN